MQYGNSEISVMEMSHRGEHYMKLHNDAILSIKNLLWAYFISIMMFVWRCSAFLLFRNVPDNYKILFMTGGGTGQFSAVCMNLMGKTGVADYIVTGILNFYWITYYLSSSCRLHRIMVSKGCKRSSQVRES